MMSRAGCRRTVASAAICRPSVSSSRVGWREAGRTLEDVSVEHPGDVLALQVGHQIDFFTGESRMLRDRIARALPACGPGMPGHHAVLGMYAFGLEETGDYRRAETYGRRSIELEPRDGWAQHAVAHVMEMQGRQHDGIAWMRANPEAWSKDSLFCVHNWWHLALYHLDLVEVDDALALFDGPIYGNRSTVVLDSLGVVVAGSSCAGSTWANGGPPSPIAGSPLQPPATTPSTTRTP